MLHTNIISYNDELNEKSNNLSSPTNNLSTSDDNEKSIDRTGNIYLSLAATIRNPTKPHLFNTYICVLFIFIYVVCAQLCTGHHPCVDRYKYCCVCNHRIIKTRHGRPYNGGRAHVGCTRTDYDDGKRSEYTSVDHRQSITPTISSLRKRKKPDDVIDKLINESIINKKKRKQPMHVDKPMSTGIMQQVKIVLVKKN
jgi:hypothetical protein